MPKALNIKHFQGTNISHPKARLKMIFCFPFWWDMFSRSLEGKDATRMEHLPWAVAAAVVARHRYERWKRDSLLILFNLCKSIKLTWVIIMAVFYQWPYRPNFPLSDLQPIATLQHGAKRVLLRLSVQVHLLRHLWIQQWHRSLLRSCFWALEAFTPCFAVFVVKLVWQSGNSRFLAAGQIFI